MNIRNKIKKASAVRDKEAYMQAANNRFGFKVRQRNIHLDIRRSRKRLIISMETNRNNTAKMRKVRSKSYELKVVGENHFWVVTELDGTVSNNR